MAHYAYLPSDAHYRGNQKNILRPPEPKKGSLSDKIIDAHELAYLNRLIDNVRFIGNVVNKGKDETSAVQLVPAVGEMQVVIDVQNRQKAATLAKDLNDAIRPVLQKFMKENEQEIRKILGRKRDPV